MANGGAMTEPGTGGTGVARLGGEFSLEGFNVNTSFNLSERSSTLEAKLP